MPKPLQPTHGLSVQPDNLDTLQSHNLPS